MCSISAATSLTYFHHGSMLSEAERLGDVDIAIELLAKVTEEARLPAAKAMKTTIQTAN